MWLILFTPLFHIPSLMFPGTSSKLIVFLSAISILLFGVFVRGDKLNIQRVRHPLILALGMLWGVTLLSTIFSINPWLSWWGNISRASGFIIITAVLIMVLIIVSQVNRLQVYKILSLMSVIGGLAGLYAIGQKIGLPELLHNTFIYASTSSRVDATFGNPLFLGSFLLITIFISLFWILNSTHLKTKILHGSFLVIQIIALLLTASRGPFLGLIIGLAIFGFLYLKEIFKWSPTTKRVISWVVFSGLLLLALIFVLRAPLGIERLFDFRIQGTIKQRLLTYDSVLQGVLDRPLLGYGIDNVYVAFDRNYNPELSAFGYGETFFDRAHNIFIDQLATSGVLGLISLLMLGMIIFYYLFKFLRTANDRSDKIISIMFVSILTAYVIQGMTSFDVITNFVYGGILLVLVVVLVSKQEEGVRSRIRQKGWLYFGRMILGAICLVPIFIWYWPTYSSAGLAGLALAQHRRGAEELADTNYSKALQYNSPFTYEMVAYGYASHIKNYANIYDAKGKKEVARQVLLNGIAVEEKFLEWEPENLQIKSFLASLNVVLTAYDKDVMRGQELFEELVTDHPNRFFLYLTWGDILVSARRPEEAISKLEHARTMVGATAEVDMWMGIANTITHINDNQAAESFHIAAEKRLAGGVQLNQILVDMIVELLVEKKQWQDAIYYRDWGIKHNGKNPDAMANLAVLYANDGQYIKAKKLAEEIIKSFPDYSDDAQTFIRSLPLTPDP
nr:hypothetical protein [uncultured bacterium]